MHTSDKDQTAPALEPDDETCTGCYGTGWDSLRECFCHCQPATAPQAADELERIAKAFPPKPKCCGPDALETSLLRKRVVDDGKHGYFEELVNPDGPAAVAKLKEQEAEIERLTKQGYELTQKLAKTQLRAEASEGRAFRAQLQRDEAEARADRAHDDAIEEAAKVADAASVTVPDQSSSASEDWQRSVAPIWNGCAKELATAIRALKKGSDNG